jgi:hypothetical protein
MSWGKLQEVYLVDQPDGIKWRWSAQGIYSAKSAYSIQFTSSFCSFSFLRPSGVLGLKASAELCLATGSEQNTHNRPLNCSKLAMQSFVCSLGLAFGIGWTSSTSLCFCAGSLAACFSLDRGLVQMAQQDVSLEEWWRASLIGRTKEERRRLTSVLLYTPWNIWKERNRRVFDGISAAAPRILALIIKEMWLRDLACAGVERVVFPLC